MKKIYLLLFSFILLQLQAQQPVTPQKDVNGNISFQLGNIFFQVNPNHGARIESFKLDGTEFLYVEHKPGAEDMYGSTAWLSPQNIWNWPPQAQIDLNAYTGGIAGNKVILTSAQATAGNIKFLMRKTFSADLQDSSVSINYTIINKSTDARSFAVWEIMRVPTGGLSFFPLNGAITGDLAPLFEIQDGIAWWDYDSLENNVNKAFADGNGGWLAHAGNNRIIEVKKFPDSPSNFPNGGNGSPLEKEIEFYADGGMNYNEIEKHTDYKLIPVGDSATLTMKWFLRKLPDNIAIRPGNTALVNYVTGVLNRSSNNIEMNSSTDEAITIFPNPSSGEIQFRGAKSGEKLTFQLLNVLGKTVANLEVYYGQTINLQSVENGMYLYRLESAGKTNVGKLIIRK
jgi:hypothetical protein